MAGKGQKSANIVLIGMPGSGKSTIGHLLAKQIRYTFLDTDEVIEWQGQGSLQQIIQRMGLRRFCLFEEQCILDLKVRDHVIATGGSVIYGKLAMRHLGAGGLRVFLDLPLEVLSKRLGDLSIRGVVHVPGQTLADLLLERLPLYRRYADLTISCGNKPSHAVVKEIVQYLSCAVAS